MSEENVEVVKRAFAAWAGGNLQALHELMAEDLVTYRRDPDGALYHGQQGFFDSVAEWTEDFSEWSVQPESFIDAGDQVVVQVRQAARGKGSGARVEEDWWFVFDIRVGSTISKMSFFRSERQALEAAELSE